MSNKRHQEKVIISSLGMNSENKVKCGWRLHRQHFVAFLMIWFGNAQIFFFLLKTYMKRCRSAYGELRENFQDYVMIISIIILNLCLAAWRLPLDWYSMTTGNRYNSSKTVIITAGMRNPSSLLFLTSLSWKVLTSAGLGYGWAAVSSGVAVFSSSWRDGRVPACTICAPDISF